MVEDINNENFEIKDFFEQLFYSKSSNSYNHEELEQNSKYFDALMKEFYNTKNMRLKADLTKDQIFLLTRANVFAETFNSKIMQKTIQFILEYSVSKDRKGRLEFSEIFKFANDLKSNEMGYDNALAGLLGMGRRL